jgi:hypothetical protein
MNDLVIPETIALVLFWAVVGGCLGVILAFMFKATAFVWAGLIGGVITGYIVGNLPKNPAQFVNQVLPPMAAPAIPSDLQHVVTSFERIFQTWSHNSSFAYAVFAVIFIAFAVAVIKLTRLHVTNPHKVYVIDPKSLPPELLRELIARHNPALLEDLRPREERRGDLPVVKGDARSV